MIQVDTFVLRHDVFWRERAARCSCAHFEMHVEPQCSHLPSLSRHNFERLLKADSEIVVVQG
jgi:hypothetical protein